MDKGIDYVPPKKKKYFGETVEEEDNEQEESGFQSTLGESIYEEFGEMF